MGACSALEITRKARHLERAYLGPFSPWQQEITIPFYFSTMVVSSALDQTTTVKRRRCCLDRTSPSPLDYIIQSYFASMVQPNSTACKASLIPNWPPSVGSSARILHGSRRRVHSSGSLPLDLTQWQFARTDRSWAGETIRRDKRPFTFAVRSSSSRLAWERHLRSTSMGALSPLACLHQKTRTTTRWAKSTNFLPTKVLLSQ
mmetsp:Transcript_5969/g.13516  ORF Transcript_5969/g.13516 Transcript_5969/m.13516 type:complete len:203 (-) Transcript_5969:341-949(-)